MKKLINRATDYVDESLAGLCAGFPGYARIGHSGRVIARKAGAARGKVAVVTGGGFGHLPLFAGYVGEGLLTSCAVGDVFAGPPAEVCAEAIRAADAGAGVLCVLGNYGGDRMSFGLACDEVEADGLKTDTVIVADDVASAAPAESDKRRGVAGMIFVFKAASAKAESGSTLAEVTRVAARAAASTRSIGIAISPCLIPGAAKPSFDLGPHEFEMGMGIHGEPGIERRRLPEADEVSAEMVKRLLDDVATGTATGGSRRVALLVNSLGATPLEELLIVYGKARNILSTAGVEISRSYIGHYATSMEMAGCSISLMFLDDELETLLAAPTTCPFWPR